jgi:hypothetical protein
MVRLSIWRCVCTRCVCVCVVRLSIWRCVCVCVHTHTHTHTHTLSFCHDRDDPALGQTRLQGPATPMRCSAFLCVCARVRACVYVRVCACASWTSLYHLSIRLVISGCDNHAYGCMELCVCTRTHLYSCACIYERRQRMHPCSCTRHYNYSHK